MHGHQKGWCSLSSTGPQGNVEKFGYSHIWQFFYESKALWIRKLDLKQINLLQTAHQWKSIIFKKWRIEFIRISTELIKWYHQLKPWPDVNDCSSNKQPKHLKFTCLINLGLTYFHKPVKSCASHQSLEIQVTWSEPLELIDPVPVCHLIYYHGD